MEGLIYTLIILIIGVSIWGFTMWRNHSAERELKELVAWSVCKDDHIRCNIPLWAHFKNAQIHTHIRDEYRISGEEEWESAKEVISEYQKTLTQSYFNNQLYVLRSKYVILEKDYFMFMLYVFLCEHKMTYSVVYHKMHYITYMYCKESVILGDRIPAWNESILKEELDDVLAKN